MASSISFPKRSTRGSSLAEGLPGSTSDPRTTAPDEQAAWAVNSAQVAAIGDGDAESDVPRPAANETSHINPIATRRLVIARSLASAARSSNGGATVYLWH